MARRKQREVPHRAYMDASIHDYVNSVQTPDEQGGRFIDPEAMRQPASVPVTQPTGEERGFANRVNYPRETGSYTVIDARPKPGPQQTEGEQMGGFIGGALDIVDDLVPDDMGGMVRGTSGWLNAVPGYKETIGALWGIPLSGGESLMNSLYWASEQSDHLAAWASSALPGGQQTLDMEWVPGNPFTTDSAEKSGIQGDVTDVSAMQSGLAGVAGLFNWSGDYANMLTALGTPLLGFAGPASMLGRMIDANNPMFKDGADLTDKATREAMFSPAWASVSTGIMDAAWDVFGDPTIIGGKASSILRYGMKAGKWTGLTNQSLRTSSHVETVSHQIDDGLKHFIDSTTGRPTGVFEHVKTLIDNDPAHLTDHVLVVNSNNPGLVMRAAQMIEPGMYDEGAALVKALFGERSGWEYLKEMRPDVFDSLYTGITGVDILSPRAAGGLLDATQTAIGKGLVRDAEAILDMTTEVGRRLDGTTFSRPYAAPKSKVPVDIPGGAVITRAGARSATAARLGDAWRIGRAEGRWGSARVSTVKAVADGGEGFIYNIVRASSGSRPVMIVRWAGRGRPTNVVHLKGGDGDYANTEVHAWLTHSKIDEATRTSLFNDFVNATGPEARRNILIEMEKAEVKAQAKRLGISESAVMLAYNSYRSMRNRKLWDLTRGTDETAFVIDENGVPVKVAGLYSELDEAFPMLDTREFQRVVRSNSKLLQSYGRTLDITVDTLDVLNNMWKVSVLLRLGYTMRNVTEGALRSVATVGVLAMHPSAIARVPSALRYAAYRRIYRNRAEAQGRALSEAQEQLIAAEKAIADWQEAAKVEELFALQEQVRELRQLVKAAEKHAQSRLWVRPVEDVPPLRVAYKAEDYEPGSWPRDVDRETKIAGQIVGPDALPPTVYHVTTNAPAVRESGVLRMSASREEVTGLGGAPSSAVSVTVDRKIAMQLRDDMRFYAGIKEMDNADEILDALVHEAGRAKMTHAQYEDVLKNLSTAYKQFNDGDISLGSFVDQATSYFWSARQSAGKGRNPILFGGVWKADSPWWRVDPLDIEVIPISRENIKATGAAVSDFDLRPKGHPGHGSGLMEARIHGDIPLDDVWRAAKKDRKRYEKDMAAAEKDAAKRQAEVDRLRRALDEKVDALHKAEQRIDDMLPQQNANVAALSAARAEAQRLAGEIDAIIAKMRSKAPKRSKVGEGGLVVGKNRDGSGIVYSNAFDGHEGEMARLLASADRTYSAVFETGFEARRSAIKNSRDWEKIDPAEFTSPADWERYWDNLTIRYNQRYAFDPIISRWLKYGDEEGTMLADTRKMLMSRKGASLRGTLRTRNGERLSDANGDPIAERVDDYLTELYRRYTDELPPGMGIRERLAQGEMMPYEVQAKWAGSRPPVIPAPVEDGAAEVKSLFGHAYSGYQTVTGAAMKYLGSIPETTLLRHPFYAAIYQDEALRLANLAKRQGANLNSRSVRAGIEKAAHREALKQTRRTMYTIERQSNISNLLRFAMPFFPAWENSIRTWGRIVWQNPAVLGAGALLWDIPNSLGWVVDENGNKVEHSNFLAADDKHFIVYPEAVLNAAAKIAGPDLPVIGRPGELVPLLNTMLPPLDENGKPMPIQTRQSSLNVVFPGGILNPGVGPMQTIPVSLMLRGKPEFTEVLRKNMPEQVFNSLIPNGNPNTPIPDMFLPTTIKKLKYKIFAGEDENTAYLRMQDSMIQDEIVRLKMAGQNVTERDMDRVLKRARKMWDWTIGQAATGFTASTGYRSPFTVERQIWRDLLDNTNLTYSQKVSAFTRKMDVLHPGHSQDFLTLTQSTSESPFGVDSTQSSWDRLTGNEDTAQFIAKEYGEEMVGMFTNIGNTGDPFSYSVYGELFGQTVDGKSLKSKMTPQELKFADDVKSGWRDYYLLIDSMDAKARKAGLDGYMQIDGIDDILSEARSVLAEKYEGYGVEISKGFDSTKINRTIQTARLIVSEADPDEFKSNQTIRSLSEYLMVRDKTADALKQVEDSDVKAEIRDLALAEVMRLRRSDMGFADFYDRYLSSDDFRKVS